MRYMARRGEATSVNGELKRGKRVEAEQQDEEREGVRRAPSWLSESCRCAMRRMRF